MSERQERLKKLADQLNEYEKQGKEPPKLILEEWNRLIGLEADRMLREVRPRVEVSKEDWRWIWFVGSILLIVILFMVFWVVLLPWHQVYG